MSADATASSDVTVTTETPKEENLIVEVTISKDPIGLGLVIGLSKKSKDKKQVVFIRQIQRRSNGSQSEAMKGGLMCAQDVVEAVNGVEVGIDLTVLTQEINKVEQGGPIKFRLSRRAKDEKRRLKMLADNKIARALDVQLRLIFNLIDEDKSGKLTLAEIDKIGKQVFLDKLGLHLGKDVIENGFSSLEQFSEVGDGQIDYEEFRGVLYSKELALSGRKTRHAKYAVVFKTLDKDANGTIDKTEFLGANDLMAKLFGENSGAIREEFEESDANSDGKISFQEFANAAEDFYERQMHPDGYVDVHEDELNLTLEQATELIDDHYNEEHEGDEVPAHIAAVTTVVQSTAAAAAEPAAEAAATAEVDEAHAAAIEAAEAAHAEAEAAKEEAAQLKHQEDLVAAKAKKVEDKRLKKEKQEREAAEAAEKSKNDEVAAPAKAGCCVIA